MTDEYWLAHCPSHQTTGTQPVWLLDILPTATTMNTQSKTMAPGHRECSRRRPSYVATV